MLYKSNIKRLLNVYNIYTPIYMILICYDSRGVNS